MRRIIIGLLLATLLFAGCQKSQPEEPTETTGGLSDILQEYAATLTTASGEMP